MSNNFYVGQEVVCINVEDNAFVLPGVVYDLTEGVSHYLELNMIYVIRDIFLNHHGQVVVLLEGIKRGYHGPDNMEMGFDIRRFRPLVKKKTDISVFTNLLKERTFVDAE